MIELEVPNPGVPFAVRISPLSELMACLHVLAEPDHHLEARRWYDGVADALPEELRKDILRFMPFWARYRLRLLYPLQVAAGAATLADELAVLAATPSDVFVNFAVNALLGRTPEDGVSPELNAHTIATCRARSFQRGELAQTLFHDPQQVLADLVACLAQCEAAFFGDFWQQALPLLERSQQRLEAAATQSVVHALLMCSSIVTLTAGKADSVTFAKLQQRRVSVGAAGLVLVPTVRNWPHVTVKMDADLPIVVHAPAQQQGQVAGKGYHELLRHRLAVLSEPGRWELSRHLLGEPITTTELSRRTGLAKPAVSRHLATLRDVGLVTTQREGRTAHHRMDPTAISALGYEALRALLG